MYCKLLLKGCVHVRVWEIALEMSFTVFAHIKWISLKLPMIEHAYKEHLDNFGPINAQMYIGPVTVH